MKEEIKEILDRLERIDHKEYIAFEFADSATFNEMARCFEERKKMADYITNLQEENERYKKLFEGKERFSKIMPDDMDFIIMSKTDYDRQVDDIELVALELRSRIDKAVEYITSEETINMFSSINAREKWIKINHKLLNLLQGEDKDGNVS